jgi:hypothetical protein
MVELEDDRVALSTLHAGMRTQGGMRKRVRSSTSERLRFAARSM